MSTVAKRCIKRCNILQTLEGNTEPTPDKVNLSGDPLALRLQGSTPFKAVYGSVNGSNVKAADRPYCPRRCDISAIYSKGNEKSRVKGASKGATSCELESVIARKILHFSACLQSMGRRDLRRSSTLDLLNHQPDLQDPRSPPLSLTSRTLSRQCTF